MEIKQILERQLDKFISDERTTHISTIKIMRDFSIPKTHKNLIVDYILQGIDSDLYIIPRSGEKTFHLIFDIDNKDNSEKTVPWENYLNILIECLLDTIDSIFGKEVNKEYIVMTHTIDRYKYHLSFPFIMVDPEKYCEFLDKLKTNTRLHQIIPYDNIDEVIDRSQYLWYKGLAYPYQEKYKGSGYYRIDPILSTLNIDDYDIHDLMEMCVKGGYNPKLN